MLADVISSEHGAVLLQVEALRAGYRNTVDARCVAVEFIIGFAAVEFRALAPFLRAY